MCQNRRGNLELTYHFCIAITRLTQDCQAGIRFLQKINSPCRYIGQKPWQGGSCSKFPNESPMDASGWIEESRGAWQIILRNYHWRAANGAHTSRQTLTTLALLATVFPLATGRLAGEGCVNREVPVRLPQISRICLSWNWPVDFCSISSHTYCHHYCNCCHCYCS